MYLTSASGYGGLEATPLARIGYYDNIIMRVWERDFIPEITNTQINERVTQCNQIVQFIRQPKVGNWRPYEVNQQLIPDQISIDAFCLQLCNAAYKDIKFDQLQIKQACDRWDSFENAFLDSLYQSLTYMWRDWVLNAMILEADPANKGANAGPHGNIDLGTLGAPFAVTPDNIQIILSRLQQVLQEQLRWEDGKMFLVVPPALMEILVSSNYANAQWMGDCVSCSLTIDGMMPKQLMGFTLIKSNFVPTAMDSSGDLAYYLIAGNRDAFAFIGDIVYGGLKEMESAFGVLYQMLAVWGGKAIYPDALAVAYVSLGS